MSQPSVDIIGAGVAGLCCAWQFAERGCQVVVRASSQGIDSGCCSWWAGGMLAPWCERESAEPLIVTLGLESSEFWKSLAPALGLEVISRGSLVLANPRDHTDLWQFADRTEQFQRVDGGAVTALEPALENRFEHGLYFETESHLDPRHTLAQLENALRQRANVTLKWGESVTEDELSAPPTADWRIDCRGLAARDRLPGLRGVRGEMLLLHLPELTLQRPVRLLHPRYPLYIVPRRDHVFMVGATMLESDACGQPTARSVMELLSAAYALHPAFGEAQVLELGADVRPAFVDNLPRLQRDGQTVYLNGLYRHGFLCGPAMARRCVDLVLDNKVGEEVLK